MNTEDLECVVADLKNEIRALTEEFQEHRPIYQLPGVRAVMGWIDEKGEFHHREYPVVGCQMDDYGDLDPLVIHRGILFRLSKLTRRYHGAAQLRTSEAPPDLAKLREDAEANDIKDEENRCPPRPEARNSGVERAIELDTCHSVL